MGKSGVLEQQKRQYLSKRANIEEKFYGGPIRSHQCSFEWYHPRPPMASFFPRLGFATPHKISNPIISGTGKATDFKFGRYIHRVHLNKSPLKIMEKMEHRHIQGLPKVFKYPLLSLERVKLQTSNFVRAFIGSIGTKAH